MVELDALIVGSGPAGCATGISLARMAPRLAERTVVIDRAAHPRPKTCGGGLTAHMQDQTESLGVDLGALPRVEIHRTLAVRGPTRRTVELERPFLVIRRAQLDAAMAEALVKSPVRLQENETFIGFERRRDGRLDVQTSRARYIVKALVAADGAGSKIARSLETRRRPSVHLAQIDLPLPDHIDPHTMIYDFTSLTRDLFGYVWIFPTPLTDTQGRPLANVGIMQVGGTRLGGGLRALLARELARWGMPLGDRRIRFHPEWAFDPAFAFRGPNLLVVGDAAGVDPMLGEGLSQCLQYGALAARALTDGLPSDRWDFSDYRQRVLWSQMGRELRLMRIPAQRFYRPGNEVWADFVFDSPYLTRLMAQQGQAQIRLQDHIVPIMMRAAWHLLTWRGAR